jgi:MbtH protein
MDQPLEQDPTMYDVVMNKEGQYSIWRTDRELPAGWSKVDVRGPRVECLQHIARVWTDMRPTALQM